MREVLTKAMMVIILQNIDVSNQYTVQLALIQFYVSYIFVKKEWGEQRQF